MQPWRRSGFHAVLRFGLLPPLTSRGRAAKTQNCRETTPEPHQNRSQAAPRENLISLIIFRFKFLNMETPSNSGLDILQPTIPTSSSQARRTSSSLVDADAERPHCILYPRLMMTPFCVEFYLFLLRWAGVAPWHPRPPQGFFFSSVRPNQQGGPMPWDPFLVLLFFPPEKWTPWVPAG